MSTQQRRLLHWAVDTLRMALALAVGLAVFSVYTARGDSHDATFYACLYSGSLSQVNTTAPPANCGRGMPIEWSSFGGTIEASQLSAELQQAIKCGALPKGFADLSGCDLSFANLTDANLGEANLSGANLTQANLSGASLLIANLTNANLSSANLTNANLPSANLTSANLTNANLRDTNLTNATLSFANLTNATLFDALLTGANLADANLTDANLTGAALGIVNWSNTICPDGTNSDDNGDTCVGHL